MVPTQFPTLPSPLVIGHRGASGHAPENSLAAFALATVRNRPTSCDGVELDIHTTLDGHFVVHHDPVVPTGGSIAEMPLSAVRDHRLSDGSPIPTLAEALDVLGDIDLFVEAKGLPPSADAALLSMLSGHRAARWHIHAFDHRIVARLRKADPTASLGVLSASYPMDPIGAVATAGAATLWQQAHLIDESLVAGCHRAGVAVVAWTVNSAEEAARLRAMGVDGLCGNWPERLR